MKTPVAFLVFNRPEPTARVFARIREARPPRLLVVCDGPRAEKPADAAKVAEVRRLVTEGVDWPCELTLDFAEKNLGCRERIASGLRAVFEQVEEAIVLEDDCLPDPTFFSFCEELLERYRNDTRVVHIGGVNLAASQRSHRASYWFTHHAWIWGWATWRRAWQQYDFEMKTWTERLKATQATYASPWEAQYWTSTYDQARRDLRKANTWGFPWMYSCRSGGGLSILPSVNLVQNIGFSADSTHTAEDMKRLERPLGSLPRLVHPKAIRARRYDDELITRIYAGEPITPLSNLKSRLRVAAANLKGRAA